MNENKFLNNSPEQVILIPNPRRIGISRAIPARAYGLFDSETGTQVSEFKKGTDGQVEFKDLNPSRHYDVGTIENMGDEKPEFAINWTVPMRDNTDDILKNSGNLPVIFPCNYIIKNNENNSNNVFDLVDNNGDKVGEVVKLAPTGDKPNFRIAWTFRMKDDTKE